MSNSANTQRPLNPPAADAAKSQGFDVMSIPGKIWDFVQPLFDSLGPVYKFLNSAFASVFTGIGSIFSALFSSDPKPGHTAYNPPNDRYQAMRDQDDAPFRGGPNSLPRQSVAMDRGYRHRH